jgi:hypothetical protein
MEKTAHTLLIETLYGQGRICARAGFKFQKVMVEGLHIF